MDFSGPCSWKHCDIYKTESDVALNVTFLPSRCQIHFSYCWIIFIFIYFLFILFFWSTCLSSFLVFLPFFWNEEWKERYCILTRVIPFGRIFFFFFLHFFSFFGLGFVVLRPRTPRPSGQRYYNVEMCHRVLKTLRRMVNIKVFYKKVYNHLDIYTNTQIYIHIYMYIPFYNMAVLKKVLITSVII